MNTLRDLIANGKRWHLGDQLDLSLISTRSLSATAIIKLVKHLVGAGIRFHL